MDKSPDAFRTISEVAEELDLPQHVLRFWETRFTQIRPLKRGGGRRYYRPDDIDLLRGIKYLLYGRGYTLRGVQCILKEEGARVVQRIWLEEAGRFPSAPAAAPPALLSSASGELREDEPEFRRSDDHQTDFHTQAEQMTADRHSPTGRDDAWPGVQTEAPLLAPGLRPDILRQLESALGELAECRRLLALGQDASEPDAPE